MEIIVQRSLHGNDPNRENLTHFDRQKAEIVLDRGSFNRTMVAKIKIRIVLRYSRVSQNQSLHQNSMENSPNHQIRSEVNPLSGISEEISNAQ